MYNKSFGLRKILKKRSLEPEGFMGATNDTVYPQKLKCKMERIKLS